MADTTSIYTRVEQEISGGRLWKAIRYLRILASKQNIHDITQRLENAAQTYSFLTDFLLRDTHDPERGRLYDSLIIELRALNDELRQARLTETDPAMYFSTARRLRLSPQNIGELIDEYRKEEAVAGIMMESDSPDLQLMKRKESLLDDIFQWIWTSAPLSHENATLIENTASDAGESEELRAQIVSALFLALLARYDSRKLSILLALAESTESEMIAARALTGVALVMVRYAQRIENDPALRSRLEMWQDSPLLYSRLRTVIPALLRGYDTDRITSSMKKDVIPEIMKLQPKIRKIFGDSKNTPTTDTPQFNPEWEDMLSSSGLGEKLRELSELQEEGADVMMAAFSNLKRFPFFNRLSNWFLPFTLAHSELPQNDSARALRPLAEMRDGMICDSDKYSLMLSLGFSQLDAVNAKISAMTEQFEQLREQAGATEIGNPTFSRETNSYVKDLYRFFRLFSRRSEFPDPFDRPFNPVALPVIGSAVADSEMTRLTMEFFLKRHYYDEALAAAEALLATELPDEGLYQKAGYCLMESGRYEEALDRFEKAELLNAKSAWLMSCMGLCLQQLKRNEEAAAYYEKALEMQPDDPGLLFSLGLNLMESGRIKEALNAFYQAHYQHPEHHFSMRGIAWSEFLSGNFETSLDYSRRLIETDCDPNDYMNAASASFALGRNGDAYRYFVDSVRSRPGDDNVAKFDNMMEELAGDLPHIAAKGLSMRDLQIILDKVRDDTVNAD